MITALEFFGYIVFCFVVVIKIFRVIASLHEWNRYRSKESAKMSFKSFLALYSVDSTDWDLYADYLTYKYQVVEPESWFDWVKYKKFYKRKNKIEERDKVRAEYLKNQAKLVKSLQESLNKQQSESFEEMKRHLDFGGSTTNPQDVPMYVEKRDGYYVVDFGNSRNHIRICPGNVYKPKMDGVKTQSITIDGIEIPPVMLRRGDDIVFYK